MSATMSYDNAGQLTSQTGPNPVNYTYGTRGNRLTQTAGAAVTTYAANPNGSIASATTGSTVIEYGFDDAGRRTSATTKVSGATTRTVTTAYDARGKASTITTAAGSTTGVETRTYDGDGSLTKFVITGGSTNDTYDQVWDTTRSVSQVLNVNVNGSLLLRVDYANERASYKTGWFPTWYKLDAHSSVINPDSNPAAASGPTKYDPFGTPTGATYFAAAYRSELQLGDTLHLRNRDYDPAVGQFVSEDPLDGVDGTSTVANPYHYVDNDPYNRLDPLGLRPRECAATSPVSGWDVAGPDAGFLERDRAQQVLARRALIERWALANGISSFLLATLIHHEGGNYLDPWRRGAAQSVDLGKLGAGGAGLGTPSVGIGNIQPGTALQVISDRYCGDPGWSNFEIGNALVESDDLSIAIAAGYLRLLKDDYPAADSRGLFIAYAASRTSNRIMDYFGWNLQSLVHAATAEVYTQGSFGVRIDGELLGMSRTTLDTLLARENHWESSSNAMRQAGW